MRRKRLSVNQTLCGATASCVNNICKLPLCFLVPGFSINHQPQWRIYVKLYPVVYFYTFWWMCIWWQGWNSLPLTGFLLFFHLAFLSTCVSALNHIYSELHYPVPLFPTLSAPAVGCSNISRWNPHYCDRSGISGTDNKCFHLLLSWSWLDLIFRSETLYCPCARLYF